MPLLEKITHLCLCYMLDERSILKASVTYSSLSTPYIQYKHFGSIINHKQDSIFIGKIRLNNFSMKVRRQLSLKSHFDTCFFETNHALMIPRIMRAIPCYRHYIQRPIFGKLISFKTYFAQFSIYNLYEHSSQDT